VKRERPIAQRYDLIVVGAGPAGLSAALILARACRSVLVCDSGMPRNAAASRLHGFLTRDAIPPLRLRALGERELHRYGVRIRAATVTHAARSGGGFLLRLADGARLRGRKLLLATGVLDRLPSLPGMESLYGRSVHHCPHCDGWEVRGRRLAVYGRGQGAAELALTLLGWSGDVALCSDGPSGLPARNRAELLRRGVRVTTRRIMRLESSGGRLRRVVFRDGDALERDAVFLATGHHHASALALDLGCRLTAKGSIWTDRRERTGVPGLYVAGDASRDVQLAIVAAAEGARAAVALHKELLAEDALAPVERSRTTPIRHVRRARATDTRRTSSAR
jgi:thioredoxin reductase